MKTKNEETQKKDLRQYYEENHSFEYFESMKDPKLQRLISIVKQEIDNDKMKEGMTQQMLFNIKNKEDKDKKDTQKFYINDPLLKNIIKSVLPDSYNDKTDSALLSELAVSLEKYRSEEMEFIHKEEELMKEKKNNIRGSIIEEDEEKAKEKNRLYLQTMLKKISMPNDHFQLLLCLMKKKKQKENEINPYIMNYKTSFDMIYNNEQILNKNGEEEYFMKTTTSAKINKIFNNFQKNLDSFSKDLNN